MKKSNNDFLFCISAKCLVDELKTLLNTYDISFFNEEIIIKKFYYDEISYFIFDSVLSRKQFMEKLEAAPYLKENINEIIFIDKNDFYKSKEQEQNSNKN